MTAILGSSANQAASAFDAAGTATTAANAASNASLQKSSNLSDLASAATARTNLGLGTAATQAASAFDAAGLAAAAQATANAAVPSSTKDAALGVPSLDSGSHMPIAESPAFTGGDVTKPAGSGVQTLASVGPGAGTYGSSSSIPVYTLDAKGRVLSVTPTAVTIPAPAPSWDYRAAARCSNGAAFTLNLQTFDNNPPTPVCFNPISSGEAYEAFTNGQTQYAAGTFGTPQNWTGGIGFTVRFASTAATTGNVTFVIDAYCVNDGSDPSAGTFGTAVTVTTTVNAVAGMATTSAVFSSVVTAGSGGCVAGTSTTPGSVVVYRIHRGTASGDISEIAKLLGIYTVIGKAAI
jgi:hypothetical protein